MSTGNGEVVSVKINVSKQGSPAGKLADAEVVFHAGMGPFEGWKLLGFGIWERHNGWGRHVTFPARSYSVNGERRSYTLLRPVSDDVSSVGAIRQCIHGRSCSWQRVCVVMTSMKDVTRSSSRRVTAPGRESVVYVRVSSKEQEREGFSIPAQRKLLSEYAVQNGLDVIHEFEDIETAKRSGRTGFSEMVRYLQERPSPRPVLLVEKTDRLYRNIRDWVTIADLALEVHLVKEGVVLSEDSRSSEKFMHGIRVLMAKNYIDNLSEEVRKGMLEKAEQGHWPTVAHVGYINNTETHRIEVDPVRGPLVAKVFEWYAAGDVSLKEVTPLAGESGLTHPRAHRTWQSLRSIASCAIRSRRASSSGRESATKGTISR